MLLSKISCDSLFLMSAVNADVRHSLNLNAKYLLLNDQSLPSIFFYLSDLGCNYMLLLLWWLTLLWNKCSHRNKFGYNYKKQRKTCELSKYGHVYNNHLKFSLLITIVIYGTLLLCISAPGHLSSVEGRFENYITNFYRRKSKQQPRSRRQRDTKQKQREGWLSGAAKKA